MCVYGLIILVYYIIVMDATLWASSGINLMKYDYNIITTITRRRLCNSNDYNLNVDNSMLLDEFFFFFLTIPEFCFFLVTRCYFSRYGCTENPFSGRGKFRIRWTSWSTCGRPVPSSCSTTHLQLKHQQVEKRQ